MTKLSGSCLCGAVSYEADCDIALALNCHCTDCQNATGSVFGTNVFVSEDEVTVTGTPSEYDHVSDRGAKMTKIFCPTCGSQLMGRKSGRAGMLSLRAGCLDQKDAIKPSMNIFCDSAVPSTVMDGALKTFPKMPG